MVDLHYKTDGQGDNLLVLMHAYPVTSDLFTKLEHYLPSNWGAIFPDLPGFGESEEVDLKALRMEYLSDCVKSTLPDNYNKLIIGGVSMGGYVTLAFAEKYPNLASGYVLMNTRDHADEDGGAGRKEVVKRIKLGEREEYIEELLPKLLGTTSMANDILVQQTKDMISKVSDRAIMQSSRGMGLRPDRDKVLDDTDKPILLITGKEDSITGPDVMKDIEQRYDKAKLEIIPNAGHYAVFEQPYHASKILSQFLTQI